MKSQWMLLQKAQDQSQGSDNTDEEAKIRVTYYPPIRHSIRPTRPPDRFGHLSMLALSARYGEVDEHVPTSYQEAMTASDNELWSTAMKEEIRDIQEKGTWELVPLPEGTVPIKNRWVFFRKKNKENETCRYRARLVAKGYSQRESIDYADTFSPVARYSSLRTLLAYVCVYDLSMLRLDVKTAFLNCTLEEEI